MKRSAGKLRDVLVSSRCSRFHAQIVLLFATVILAMSCARQAEADPSNELKVATFNLNHPPSHPDAVFERWGRDLAAQVDVLLITEAYEQRRTGILATAAGMPHVELWDNSSYPDVAIASRTPLYRVHRQLVDRPGRLSNNDAKILSVMTDIRGIPHQFITSHWAIRDSDIHFEPDWEATTRQATADAMVALIDPAARVVILGGDFNAHSFTSEIKTIAAVAIDSFTAAGFLEGQGPCPGNRIDYIFFKGPVRLASYNANCTDNGPSDHPIVYANFAADAGSVPLPGPSPRVPGSAAVNVVSRSADKLDIFVSDEQGAVHTAAWNPSFPDGWHGWQRLGVRAGPGAPVQAASRSQDKLDVFVAGDQGGVYTAAWEPSPSNDWPGWRRLSDLSGRAPSVARPGAHVTVVSRAPDKLDAFIVRSDDHVYTVPVQPSPPNGSYTWSRIGDIVVSAGSAIHGVSRSPDHMDIFATDVNGVIWTATWDTAGWHGWSTLLGGHARPGAPVTAVSRRTDQLDVFVTGTDGRVWTAAWNPSSGWRGWWPIGSAQFPQGAPVHVASRSLDLIDVFGTDVNGDIRTAAWEPAFGWRGWWGINGGKAAPGAPVTVVSRSKDKLDVFVSGTDRQVWTAAWEPAFGWRGWWSIGQSAPAAHYHSQNFGGDLFAKDHDYTTSDTCSPGYVRGEVETRWPDRAEIPSPPDGGSCEFDHWATPGDIHDCRAVIHAHTVGWFFGGTCLSRVREVPQPSPPNLAAGKPATQSSTGFGGEAGRAVDGNLDGDWNHSAVTHTNLEAQPWWQVDLGAVSDVGEVVLYNRTDCCSERLANFEILLSNDGVNWQTGASFGGPAPARTELSIRLSGRFVRVRLSGTNYLSLAEVQVFAAHNLAAGKKATQSSNPWGADASRAVDGNTDGNWNHSSVTHTNLDAQAWWQVDLGEVTSIGEVVLYNRTDCCSERLADFDLLLSNDGVNWQPGAGLSGPASARTVFSIQASGRFVRVRLRGTNYLSLAEVRVFAPRQTSQPSPPRPPPPPPAPSCPASFKCCEFSSDHKTCTLCVRPGLSCP